MDNRTRPAAPVSLRLAWFVSAAILVRASPVRASDAEDVLAALRTRAADFEDCFVTNAPGARVPGR
jgi:hypothetical protein